MSEYDIRPVAVDERRAASDTLRVALLSGAINDENFAALQESWDESDALAAWEGGRCVGHVARFRFDSTVPGGARVQTAGVTRVGVLPTHTRRGLLTQLMHQLLRDAHDNGNVLAALHASETSIYRRFGFAIATDAVAAVITTGRTRPWRSAPLPGSMRLLPHTQVLDVVPDLYERVARWRVGSISRPAWMWPRILKNASQPAAEMYGKGSFVAVHSDAGGADDGFVFYEVDWDETFATNPTGAGKVHDLWGASPEVELELWRYLLDIDLITTWRAEPRPVDEPVRRAMHDARAYEAVQRFDDQWIRILDVDAALTARTYNATGESVRVGVHDPMFPTNTGTWTISAAGAERSDTPSDVEVDIGTLSAASLGGVSWHDLAAIGAVTTSDGLLIRLDTLFAVLPAPFCGTGY
jgi:predicted acetyltransferase